MKVIYAGTAPHRFSAAIQYLRKLRIYDGLEVKAILTTGFEQIDKFKDAGIPVLANARSGTGEPEMKFHRIKDWRNAVFDQVSTLGLAQQKPLMRLYSQMKGKLKATFEKEKPDVIVLTSERSPNFDLAFLKAAQELHIPTIVPYLTYTGDSETLLRYRAEKKRFNRNWLIDRYLRANGIDLQAQVKNGKYFYLPERAVCYQKMGVLPSNPWQPGAGFADRFCFGFQSEMNRALQAGVDADKVRLTGDIAFDNLFERYRTRNETRSKILHEYQLAPGGKILIVSLPPYAEHNLLSWKEHWEQVRFVKLACESLNINILYSLHPRMNPSDYQFLESKHGKLLRQPLDEVLVIADIFTSSFSSTAFWAVLCGIPSVIFDFLNYDYQMFDHLTSVVIEKRQDKYAQILNDTLAKRCDFTSDWLTLGRENIFTGKVVENCYQSLQSAIGRSSANR